MLSQERKKMISTIILIIASSGFAVWLIYSSAMPSIQQVQVLQRTYPNVIELNWRQFDNSGAFRSNTPQLFENQLVHLVGHMYTPDLVSDPLFGFSFINDSYRGNSGDGNDSEIMHETTTGKNSQWWLALNRTVDVYREVKVAGMAYSGDRTKNVWQNCVANCSLYRSAPLPFSSQSFVADPIYLTSKNKKGNNTSNTTCDNTGVRLVSDDVHFLQSFQSWAVPFNHPVHTVEITNTTPKYKQIYYVEEQSSSQPIYRPASSSAAGVLHLGDIRISYSIVPLPECPVSIVASLSCSATSTNSSSSHAVVCNDTDSAISHGIDISCNMRSYIASITTFNQNNDVSFNLVEQGNYTLKDMYHRAYRTTIRQTIRPFAFAILAGILAICLQIFFLWEVCDTEPKCLTSRHKKSTYICICDIFGSLIFATVMSFFVTIFIFSMIWIANGTSKSIMIPIASVSFIVTVYLYSIHIISQATRQQIVEAIYQWVLRREHPRMMKAISEIQLTVWKQQ